MTRPLFPEISVNGRPIAARDIAAEAQNQTAPSSKPGLAWRKAAQALVIREVLMQEAARLNLKPAPQAMGDDAVETDDESLVRILMEQEITPAPAGEDDLRRIYQDHPDMCRAPGLFQPSHILLPAPPEDQTARDAARLQAIALIAELQKSPRSFGEMARRESTCGSKDADGQLGQVPEGTTVPAFEAAMRVAEVGQIHPEPVETPFGIHILRMDERIDGDILPFETVRPHLARALEKSNWTRAARDYVDGLLARADVVGFDPTVIVSESSAA